MNRIHTKALGDAREHLAAAEASLRAATLAATDVQEAAAAAALAEIEQARSILEGIRPCRAAR